jgi:hypothetical protein
VLAGAPRRAYDGGPAERDTDGEFRSSVVPAFSGGGKPYFPPSADLRLRLVEERAFRSGTV